MSSLWASLGALGVLAFAGVYTAVWVALIVKDYRSMFGQPPSDRGR
jgi:hypothetical protein